MGRKVIYHTIEEKREAQNEASRKYQRKKRELKESGEILEKPITFSYSREYHQLRYKLKKEKLLQEQGSE
jgi:peptide methionine sulfoxide reductase MsrA